MNVIIFIQLCFTSADIRWPLLIKLMCLWKMPSSGWLWVQLCHLLLCQARKNREEYVIHGVWVDTWNQNESVAIGCLLPTNKFHNCIYIFKHGLKLALGLYMSCVRECLDSFRIRTPGESLEHLEKECTNLGNCGGEKIATWWRLWLDYIRLHCLISAHG